MVKTGRLQDKECSLLHIIHIFAKLGIPINKWFTGVIKGKVRLSNKIPAVHTIYWEALKLVFREAVKAETVKPDTNDLPIYNFLLMALNW